MSKMRPINLKSGSISYSNDSASVNSRLSYSYDREIKYSDVASVGETIHPDTSERNIKVELPPSPEDGDKVRFINYSGTWDENQFTVAQPSDTSEAANIDGKNENYNVSGDIVAINFIYNGADDNWEASADTLGADYGVSTGDIPQLEDVSGEPGYPAADGSQITNVDAKTVQTRAPGTDTGDIVYLENDGAGNPQLPAVDGSQLTGVVSETGVDVSEDGGLVLDGATNINFDTGFNVIGDTSGDSVTVQVEGGGTGDVSVSDSGSVVVSNVSDINFTGTAVSVSDDGDDTVTVDISSGSVSVSDDGSNVLSAASDINFGTNLSVSDDGDGTVTVSASGSGRSLPNLRPDDFSLDDTNTGSSRGNVFGMIETIDFTSGEDGSAWITFNFPTELDESSDVLLDIYYVLSGDDNDKSVDIQIDSWAYSDGDIPNPDSPDNTATDTLNTGTAQGVAGSMSLTNIPASILNSSTHTITLKVTRVGSSDTYTGTFQMMYLRPSQ